MARLKFVDDLQDREIANCQRLTGDAVARHLERIRQSRAPFDDETE